MLPFLSVIRSFGFASRKRASQRSTPRCFSKPCLEELEMRLVPNAYTWTGQVSNDWGNPMNWIQ